MHSIGIVLLAFSSLIVSNEALSCLPCDPARYCKGDTSQCKFGIVKDVCRCCDECAKGPGEICGGYWMMSGECGKGLFCHPKREPKLRNHQGQCSTQPLTAQEMKITINWSF